MEEITQEKRWTHAATIPITEEKLAQIQKEIEDQEVIIQGYQQVTPQIMLNCVPVQFQKQNCLMITTFLLKTGILFSKKWVGFGCEGQTYCRFKKSFTRLVWIKFFHRSM